MDIIPSPYSLMVLLVMLLFVIGMITFIVGLFILAFRASGTEIKALVAQTERIAQKGLAEDMVGLVANASELINALNQLVHTTRGIGLILILMGMLMMGTASWLAFQILQMQL